MDFQLKPRTAVNRRAWQERVMVAKRNREADTRHMWDSAAKYFRSWQVQAAEYESIASNDKFKSSREAYENRKTEETRQKNLEERRRRLLNMLQKENFQYEIELKEKFAEQRKIKSAPTCHRPVKYISPTKSREKLDILPSDRGIKEKPIKRQDDPPHDISPILVSPKHSLPVSFTPVDLDKILIQIKQAENDSAVVKKDQRNLSALLQELERREDLRISLRRKRKKEAYGGRYMRPYKVQLQMRGREIIEYLEFDSILLDFLTKCWRTIVDTTMREEFLKDIDRIRQNLFVQLKREQVHLEFVEGLFQEEAEQVWHRKVFDWNEDLKVGDSIINKLLRATITQLHNKMTTILESLQRNINIREDLVKKLETSKQPSGRQTWGFDCRTATVYLTK